MWDASLHPVYPLWGVPQGVGSASGRFSSTPISREPIRVPATRPPRIVSPLWWGEAEWRHHVITTNVCELGFPRDALAVRGDPPAWEVPFALCVGAAGDIWPLPQGADAIQISGEMLHHIVLLGGGLPRRENLVNWKLVPAPAQPTGGRALGGIAVPKGGRKPNRR